AAPGDVIVLDKDTLATTTNPTYYVVEGTSLAAPQVTGAAALVWQAFPYFTNDLVRQTLLGTADPLGGSQPNPTFGYGELDVGKAVQGPAQFNWGDVSVTFDGITSTWSNDISGAGGLIKTAPARWSSRATTVTRAARKYWAAHCRRRIRCRATSPSAARARWMRCRVFRGRWPIRAQSWCKAAIPASPAITSRRVPASCRSASAPSCRWVAARNWPAISIFSVPIRATSPRRTRTCWMQAPA